MSRPTVRRLLVALAAGTAAAALDALPAPAGLTVHPDGATGTWHLSAPGTWRVEPGWEGVLVTGARRWHQESRPRRAEPPAELAELVAERDAVSAALRRLAVDEAAWAARDRRLRRWLEADPIPAGVPAVLDAAMAARAAVDADRTAIDRRIAALRDRIDAHAVTGDPFALAALAEPVSLSAEVLAADWSRLVRPGADTLLVVDGDGPVVVHARHGDVRWEARSRIVLAPAGARCERWWSLIKPADLGLPAIPVRVSTDPALAPGDGGEPPHLRLSGRQVADPRGVSSGSSVGSWGFSARSAEPAAPSAAVDALTAGSVMDMAAVEVAVPAADREPSPVAGPELGWAWPVGVIALPAGQDRVELPPAQDPVAIVTDERALIPAHGPSPVRRIRLRLAAPLLAGDLAVVEDGAVLAQARHPFAAPGRELDLAVGADDRLHLGRSPAWAVDPAEQGPGRQRQGTDHWIWNRSGAPIPVAVYLTMPVSRSQEVTVSVDEATTPGWTVVQPGLLRWQLSIPPGAPTRVGLGWRLRAREGLQLPPVP